MAQEGATTSQGILPAPFHSLEPFSAWVLAKGDVEANPALAQGLRVQGIPAVKAVGQGQLVAEFIQPHPSLTELFGETVISLTGRSLNA